jgi:hypothetical protein
VAVTAQVIDGDAEALAVAPADAFRAGAAERDAERRPRPAADESLPSTDGHS